MKVKWLKFVQTKTNKDIKHIANNFLVVIACRSSANTIKTVILPDSDVKHHCT